RLELGLSQSAVAKQLRVNPFTILNWEKERTAPRTIDGGRLIAFLGYYPFPTPITIGERLVRARRERGWSAEQAASYLGVHRTTWQGWERGELILFRRPRAGVAGLLGLDPQ